jgi:hydrogenase maturation factor
MRVLGIDPREQLAACVPVDGPGREQLVEIALVDAVAVDDVLLVHGGTAIARLQGSGPRQPEARPA